MLTDDLYDWIFEDDDTWLITGDGRAMVVNDGQLWDC